MRIQQSVLKTIAASTMLALCITAVTLAVDTRQQSSPTRLQGAAMRTQVLPKKIEIDLALGAAPAHLRADAAIYVFGPSGYVLERAGKNGFTCLVNRDAFLDGYEALKPTCFDAEGTARIVPMVMREGASIAKGVDASTIRQDIEGAFARGDLKPPARNGIAYMLHGDVSALDTVTGAVLARSHPPHLMFYAPGSSNADFGFGTAEIEGLPRPPFVYRRNQYHGYVIVTLAR